MIRIKRIIVATDFSLRAALAVRRAALLSAQHGAELHLLHVIDTFYLGMLRQLAPMKPIDEEQRLLRWAGSELKRRAEQLRAEHGVDSQCHVATGHAHEEINRYAESLQADMIVMGAQGENFIREIFFGSTTMKTLFKCHHSILAVRTEVQTYKRVLVLTNFSPSSRQALLMALKVAPQAAISFLHVCKIPSPENMHTAGIDENSIQAYRTKALDDAQATMSGIIADCCVERNDVEIVVEFGYPPAVIKKKAQSFGADLLVIGKGGEAGRQEVLLSSVAKHVMYETEGDILLVDAGR
jgi:nucleotide-binding universal stress UspA family protein